MDYPELGQSPLNDKYPANNQSENEKEEELKKNEKKKRTPIKKSLFKEESEDEEKGFTESNLENPLNKSIYTYEYQKKHENEDSIEENLKKSPKKNKIALTDQENNTSPFDFEQLSVPDENNEENIQNEKDNPFEIENKTVLSQNIVNQLTENENNEEEQVEEENSKNEKKISKLFNNLNFFPDAKIKLKKNIYFHRSIVSLKCPKLVPHISDCKLDDQSTPSLYVFVPTSGEYRSWFHFIYFLYNDNLELNQLESETFFQFFSLCVTFDVDCCLDFLPSITLTNTLNQYLFPLLSLSQENDCQWM